MKFRPLFATLTALALVGIGTATAAPIDVTWIGTWQSTGAGNVAAGGPGMAAGQRFVVKATYDSASATGTADVLTEFFADSGQDMTTVDLTLAGHSLDIFVPMEGLDAGSPFIYTQNETNHFPLFIPAPTLNFSLGSSIADTANIIGLEFEGDYAGANFNIIELFNTAAGAASPINQIGQVVNCGDAACTGFAIAAREVNGLAAAAAVSAADSTVTYDAAALTQTTALVVQGNDLGAGRSDGETFLDGVWSVPGVIQANGYDIAVAIANSGLTSTTSTANWGGTVTEEMTDLSDTATVVVDYANASPSATLSATANATGYDFAFSADDLDLAVNALIGGFEALSFTVFVNGVATTFFDMLLATGLQSETEVGLFGAFGLGNHLLEIAVQDLAGVASTASASFLVDNAPAPRVPEPAVLALLLLGLMPLGLRRQGRRASASIC